MSKPILPEEDTLERMITLVIEFAFRVGRLNEEEISRMLPDLIQVLRGKPLDMATKVDIRGKVDILVMERDTARARRPGALNQFHDSVDPAATIFHE